MKSLMLGFIVAVCVGCGSSSTVKDSGSTDTVNDAPKSPVINEKEKVPPSIPVI